MVTRESEWDGYSLSQALAYTAWLKSKCGTCGQTGGFRAVKHDDRDVTWPDGTVARVSAVRCLYCGAEQAVRGDYDKAHEKDERVTGRAMDRDGRLWVAHKPDKS